MDKSADFAQLDSDQPSTSSVSMSQTEPPLVRELREVIKGLQDKSAAQARQIEELRTTVLALMEPDMPRILRTPGGIMRLDKPDA